VIDREELEPDLDHRLGLARLGLAPSTEVRRRVWDALGGRPGSEPIAPPARLQRALVGPARGVPTLVTMALMGLSFVAGYWLRAQSAPTPLAVEVQSAASSTELGQHVGPANANTGGASAAGGASGSSADAEPDPVDDASAATPAREPATISSTGVSPTGVNPTGVSPVATRPESAAARAARAGSTVIQPRPHTEPSADPDELALLQRTERALRNGDPSLAVSFLDELDERFPNTLLGEERTAARILAECARSEVLARARALRFIGDRADSVYSDRIRRACHLEVATPGGSSEEPEHRGH
jgi:hypothetical protein